MKLPFCLLDTQFCFHFRLHVSLNLATTFLPTLYAGGCTTSKESLLSRYLNVRCWHPFISGWQPKLRTHRTRHWQKFPTNFAINPSYLSALVYLFLFIFYVTKDGKHFIFAEEKLECSGLVSNQQQIPKCVWLCLTCKCRRFFFFFFTILLTRVIRFFYQTPFWLCLGAQQIKVFFFFVLTSLNFTTSESFALVIM